MLFIYFHSSRSPLPLSVVMKGKTCSVVLWFLYYFFAVFLIFFFTSFCWLTYVLSSVQKLMLMSELIKQTGLYEKGF